MKGKVIMIQTQTHYSRHSVFVLALLLSAFTALQSLAFATDQSAATGSATAQSQHRINVNTADAETLATLPGVGPTIAQRIIEGRPYQKLADLEKVKGLT